MKDSVILNVYGKVQGVGFRYYTNKKASELNISGYVRNMPDGSVYIEAEGEGDNLEAFINWCKIGPSWARVVKVDKQKAPITSHNGFRVR